MLRCRRWWRAHSWWYRKPVLTAWFTPGAALLAATHGVSMPEAIGAFIACGALITLSGGYAFNLAAITAAICMGPDAHPDPARRYTAVIFAGVFYLAIAGLALIGTIAGALAGVTALAVRQLRILRR